MSSSASDRLIHLRAGPLTAVLERESGFLRYVRLGGREILRGIYGAVRDHNWGTVPPRVFGLQVDQREEFFRITFQVEHQQSGVSFLWKGTISGDADGRVEYVFDGEARSEFLRNRIGLCILHPNEECAGASCVVEHDDGSITRGEFPRLIAPHQPFFSIRAITHEVAPDIETEVRFAGDLFEMEDQRNWTDASFKTYSTPLALPFPVKVEKGTRIRQSVTLLLHGEIRRSEAPAAAKEVVTLSPSTGGETPLPPIGLGSACHGEPLTAPEIVRLRALQLAHLRLDLELSKAGWVERLRHSAHEAAAIGAALHVALHLTDQAEEELSRAAEALQKCAARIALILVFHTGEKATATRWIRLAQERLAVLGSKVQIAGGAPAYFTELNRNPHVAETGALPCYSITPQVHAFDDTSLVETLAAQPVTVASAWELFHQPVVVSPITLRPRFNPNATCSEPPTGDELPPEIDVRQATLFGAAWTLGSIARLASAPHLHSLTYFETTGWRGVMEREFGSPMPEKFRSTPGAVFPMYHVFASLAGFTHIQPILSSDPLRIEAMLLLDKDCRCRLLAANLTAEPQPLSCPALPTSASVQLLTEESCEFSQQEPGVFFGAGDELKLTSGRRHFELPPHAIARLDFRSAAE